jgi:2-polyprenyl-3-methyl-5-hydroxy-6-metoxy-1,4-benzoquinol methylase
MDSFNFKEFYENQHDYAGFRNDPAKREEYATAVNWKVKNLCGIVPDSLSFGGVMEVGCALGILLNKVADSLNIADRTGIDIATENIKLASGLFPKCKFFNGTLEEFIASRNIEAGRKITDLVVLSDIVEHIPDDKSFMRNVAGMTNYVLLNLPLEKCYHNRNRKYGTSDPSGHLRNYNKDDADYLAVSSGFYIVKCFTVNAHTDRNIFRIFRTNRNARVRSKPLPKMLFWMVFYFIEDLVLKISPVWYSKIYGSNYFAILKSAR